MAKQSRFKKPDIFKVSEVELIYRNKIKAKDRPKIATSGDAFHIFDAYWNKNKIALQEQFNILLLDRSNRCMGISEVSSGGVAGTIVDPKIIFAIAVKARASGLIMAHNHPSGNLEPSIPDLKLTHQFGEAAKLMGMKLLDHLILSPDGGYHSMCDNDQLSGIPRDRSPSIFLFIGREVA